MSGSKPNLIKQYISSRLSYSTFQQELDHLVTRLLNQNRIRVHSISSRIKDETSLERKIDKAQDKYSSLADITDIVGLRIITYFNDEVDAIAKLIEQEFNIDPANSVDKRALLDPDRFGYLSIHYVVSLSGPRRDLPEHREFSSLKAEIQIRSILQHTWAEIEHDLGYKSKEAIPRDIRRSFSRLAGLLEIADIEFTNIRDRLEDYEITVPEKISARPSDVLIDQVSLKSFTTNNKLLLEINQSIAKKLHGRLKDTPYIDVVKNVTHVGLKTIEDIELALKTHKQDIIAFAVDWLNGGGTVLSTIGLFYLCYVLIGHAMSIEKALDYVETMDITSEDSAGQSQEKIAADIIETYNRITSQIKT